MVKFLLRILLRKINANIKKKFMNSIPKESINTNLHVCTYTRFINVKIDIII